MGFTDRERVARARGDHRTPFFKGAVRDTASSALTRVKQ